MIRRPIQALLIGAVTLSPWSMNAMPSAGNGEIGQRSAAIRVGWAYGLGGELEYRPGAWGVGVSGGYVPTYGAGGYAGIHWGARPLGFSGLVAETGLFYGLHNPLRAADAGPGLYALGGCEFVPTQGTSIRIVAGEGVPFANRPPFPTFEFLAKLTAGIVF